MAVAEPRVIKWYPVRGSRRQQLDQEGLQVVARVSERLVKDRKVGG